MGFWDALSFLDSPWGIFLVLVVTLFLVFFNVLYGSLPVWFVWVAFVLLSVCFAFFGLLMRWKEW